MADMYADNPYPLLPQEEPVSAMARVVGNDGRVWVRLRPENSYWYEFSPPANRNGQAMLWDELSEQFGSADDQGEVTWQRFRMCRS